MSIFKAIFIRNSHLFTMIILILFFIFTILAETVCSQLPNIPVLPAFSGLSFPGAIFPYIPAAGTTSQQISPIIIGREFPPDHVNQENVSFYIKTSSPVSINLQIITKNGQIFRLELIPENGETSFTAQSARIIIHMGSEKLDGKWHKWELNSLEDLLAGFERDFAFISKLEIRGEEFCIGSVTAFSEDEGEVIETTYLVSFMDERDNIQDYGLTSFTSVSCEYHKLIELENEEIEEGYVCLSPGQQSQQSQTPQIPINFVSAPLGLGPLLPMTVFSPTIPANIPNGILPLVYPSGFSPARLASQFYSTPINPGLAFGLLQSIPLYINAQTGLPYSVTNNLIQSYDQLPVYPTRIDYTNNPAYSYLGLNVSGSTSASESAGSFIPAPYYP
ncbi:MAG: hypothetical protein ACMUIU_15490 [bacterium]